MMTPQLSISSLNSSPLVGATLITTEGDEIMVLWHEATTLSEGWPGDLDNIYYVFEADGNTAEVHSCTYHQLGAMVPGEQLTMDYPDAN